jgi:single-strand DNA-binding protein
MQTVIIAGNIGRSAETRDTASGSVTSFSVAVSGRNNATTWYKCSIWGARGGKLEPYLLKGGKVTVSGSLEAGVYEGKPDLKINVNDVTLQGGNPSAESTEQRREPMGRKAAAPAYDEELNDDVPF